MRRIRRGCLKSGRWEGLRSIHAIRQKILLIFRIIEERGGGFGIGIND